MVQSDDFLDEKSLRKDQIEHAKMIYERNKEIYKYTFESMKCLDSKLTRALTLATFTITVQTGLLTFFLFKVEITSLKILISLCSVCTYILLFKSITAAISMSNPRPSIALGCTRSTTNSDLHSFKTDFLSTLVLYQKIALDLAAVDEQTSDENHKNAYRLIDIHRDLKNAIILTSASFVFFVFINSLFFP